MTEREFAKVCSLQQAGAAVEISYQEFNMTGKLIGCGEDFLVIEINGRQTIWPREICETKQRTYPGPTYS